MGLFLLAFFLIYLSLHGYAYLKIRGVMSLTGWHNAVAGAVVFLLVTMPVATRLLEYSHESGARVTAYLGYSWMGFLFFFVAAALGMDLLGLLCVLGQWLYRSGIRWPWSPKISFYLPATLALLACGYGLIEANRMQINTITLMTDKLPPGRERLRIVQISDLHLGLIVREPKLRQVVEQIKELNPDVFVSTGDLLDGQVARLSGLAEMFQQLTPPLGKFAVTGNHEFYVGIKQVEDFMGKAQIKLLRGESVVIEDWLMIGGLDDSAALRMGGSKIRDNNLFETVSPETFVLLLKHRPAVDLQWDQQVDLQLSGHVHNGQIFPFNLLIRLVYPVPIGLSQPVAGFFLYVSRGTGTWGPPFRLFAPPEITVLDLVRPDDL